jgi:hypothetical protein
MRHDTPWAALQRMHCHLRMRRGLVSVCGIQLDAHSSRYDLVMLRLNHSGVVYSVADDESHRDGSLAKEVAPSGQRHIGTDWHAITLIPTTVPNEAAAAKKCAAAPSLTPFVSSHVNRA